MSNQPEETMTVDIELEDGSVTNCEVITILEVEGKDYIVLYPTNQNPDDEESEVWFYGYKENPADPNEEPELIYIDDEDEYEAVAAAFEAYLEDLDAEEL